MGLQAVMKDFNRAGLTSVGETFGIGVDEADYNVLFETWRRKQMTVRVGLHIPTVDLQDAKKWIEAPANGRGDDMLLWNGLGEGVLISMGDGYLPKQFPINQSAKEELSKIISLGAQSRVNFQFHTTLETTMNAMLDSLEAVHSLTPINDLRITVFTC
jgi:predicted amidohydrolase YtcJ